MNKTSWQKTTLALIVSMTIFILADYLGGKSSTHSGVIIEGHFRPKKTYLKKQRKTDSQGHTYTKKVRKKRPENWYFIVKSNAGEKLKIECEREVFHKYKVGQHIQYEITEGLFTGFNYQEKITLIK